MKVLISSDFCPGNRVLDFIEQNDNDKVFNDFTAVIAQADYAIVNLECPIIKGDEKAIKKIGPTLSTSKKSIEFLKNAGFDAVTLANNHIRDFGDEGVLNTINVCSEQGLAFVGAGKQKSTSSEVLYFTVKDVKVGVYNVCESEFSISTESNAGANAYNPILDYKAINEARPNCDFIIVIYHGGHEGYNLPSPRMKQLCHFYVDLGVDAVICHHAHVYSGYEVYQGAPIFYGLGNFCFDKKNRYNIAWTTGYSVILNLEKNKEISFELFFYRQGTMDCPGVVLITGEGLIRELLNLETLNQIIADDFRLKNEFEKMCFSKSIEYLLNFEPYTNKYLKALYRRNLLPSFFSGKSRRMTNLLRCEAHRDVVLTILSQKNPL